MNTAIQAAIRLLGKGLRELMHLIWIVSAGMLTYYLLNDLPIDHMIAIALSVGGSLLAAYGVYGAGSATTVAVMSHDTSDDDDDLIRVTDSIHSDEIDNIYFDPHAKDF